jgi:ectoine hydroxylase-related dioxygenase (phytanoyl-CoA dioxygenase family)
MLQADRYKDQGYVLAKGFFDPREVQAIRAEAKQIFTAQMLRLRLIAHTDPSEVEFEQGMFKLFEADLTTFSNCGKHAQHLISLHQLSLDRRILAALRDLGLGFATISTRPLLYFNSRRLAKKEVYWRLALHQDWRSMQGSLDAVVVWIPLVAINRALGALEVVPGSHKWGLLESKMEDGYGRVIDDASPSVAPVAVEVDPGDALFFSALLLHRSGTNETESIRWSCHFRYNNIEDPTFVARGFPHPYIYRPQEELITPEFPTRRDVEAVFG